MDWKDYDNDAMSIWSADVNPRWQVSMCEKACQTDDGIWHDDAEVISERLYKIEYLLQTSLQSKTWWRWLKDVLIGS